MFRKMKNFLRRFSITHRVGNAILDKIESVYKDLLNKIKQLDNKIEYLFWITQRKDAEEMADTKQRVFMSLPKATGESRAIQLMNNVILRKLKAECDANGIEFFLFFGTMLGAVRNQGFVPWDDDVDLCMMRSEYLKLVKVLETSKELQIDNCYSSMYQMFVKVKLKESDKFFVDIFIFDEFDADDNNAKERFIELNKANLSYVQKIRTYMHSEGVDATSYNIPRVDDKLNSMMIKHFEELSSSIDYYGSGNFVCMGIDNPTFTRNECSAYRKSELFPGVEVKFEGERYLIFRNYDHWMRNIYGDYWTFPRDMISGHGDLDDISAEDFSVMVRYGIIDEHTADEYASGKRKFATKNIDY